MAHHAVQLAVAPAFSLQEATADAAQTALSWSSGLRAFVGPVIAGKRAGLRVSDGTLFVAEAERPLAALPLAGMTRGDALTWLSRHFDEVLRLPPHDLPEHDVASGGRFGVPGEEAVLLARWLGGAATFLEGVTARIPGASTVRLWSHHFDVASLVTLATGRSIGLGLSPGDSSYDEPYWYVTPWPYPKHEQRPQLLMGAWHQQGWVGAVLTREGPTDDLGDAATRARVQAFMTDAAAACRQLVGPA